MVFKSIKENLKDGSIEFVDMVYNTITCKFKENTAELTVEGKCEYVRIVENGNKQITALSFPHGPYFVVGKSTGVLLSPHTVVSIEEVKCPIEKGCKYKHMYKIKIDKCLQKAKWLV